MARQPRSLDISQECWCPWSPVAPPIFLQPQEEEISVLREDHLVSPTTMAHHQSCTLMGSEDAPNTLTGNAGPWDRSICPTTSNCLRASPQINAFGDIVSWILRRATSMANGIAKGHQAMAPVRMANLELSTRLGIAGGKWA